MSQFVATIQTSLQDNLSFPKWADCPLDEGVDKVWEKYYTGFDTGTLSAKRHWCFIGEIEQFTTFSRPCVVVRDKAGKQIVVAYYLKMGETPSLDFGEFVPGRTIAILYPERHQFLDGTAGIRIEESGTTQIIPSKLSALMSLNNKLVARLGTGGKVQKCSACEKASGSLSRCGRCNGAFYCDKNCQMLDWKEQNHKTECKAIKKLLPLITKDWGKYESHDDFPL